MQNRPHFRILLILLTCLGGSLSAQYVQRASEVYPEHRFYSLVGGLNPILYARVQGNPYLQPNGASGSIRLKDGSLIPQVPIILDICAHQLLVYNEFQKRIVAMPSEVVDSFSLDYLGRRVTFRCYQPENSGFHSHDRVFLQVLSAGEQAFLKYVYKEKIKLSTPDALYSEKFKSGFRYYCLINNQLVRVKLKESFFKKNFPDRFAQVKAFITENRLKVSQESDFARVMDYLNQ